MVTNFETLNYYQKVNYIFQNLTLIVCIFGMLGNILLIVVFSKKRLSKYSYSFFSRAKAFGDILVLLFGFRNWFRYVLGANLDTVTWIFCIIFNKLVIYIGTILSIWLMALITLDRLVTIMYPNRLKFLKKRSFQYTSFIFIFVYSVVINIILPLNTDLRYLKSGNETIKVTCNAASEVLADHSWIISSHIFFVILLVNNLMILFLFRHILASRRKVAVNVRFSTKSSRDRKFAITTIGLSIMAVVFKLPKMLVNIVLESAGVYDDVYLMWFSIGITIFDIETGCSFYLNLLLNPSFYNEFLHLFCFQPRVERTTVSRTVKHAEERNDE